MFEEFEALANIKVIGVGGGGSNAVNHMYNEGIHDVTFVVCNTDNKALQDSPVPEKIQLGSEGLGAGNRPEKARKATEESIEAIKNMLSDGTKMAFITAGMGGGTGTGAAPVVARIAKEMNVVGLMNMQYAIEGGKVYVLEANPRASRTVPLVSKVCDIRMVQLATDIMTTHLTGRPSPVPTLKEKKFAQSNADAKELLKSFCSHASSCSSRSSYGFSASFSAARASERGIRNIVSTPSAFVAR